ncbi:hypothetical protein [Streptacidiphilus sp. P02-A3a]|uniref:hypothetical protein n=1 Tax=Streptacidiphilus sp. P02-A3a TaxID=2704468 RepID=UPI0015FE391C|nr:hypothetical protein [Streptacidiphilus sp. P02-A3a]QMU68002.1 hypothetical protein GXP74_07005 [Streptacidiphilus sp. P02-A3a]
MQHAVAAKEFDKEKGTEFTEITEGDIPVKIAHGPAEDGCRMISEGLRGGLAERRPGPCAGAFARPVPPANP